MELADRRYRGRPRTMNGPQPHTSSPNRTYPQAHAEHGLDERGSLESRRDWVGRACRAGRASQSAPAVASRAQSPVICSREMSQPTVAPVAVEHVGQANWAQTWAA